MHHFKIFNLFIIFTFSLLSGCSNTLDTGGDESFSTRISYTVQSNSHVKLWIENSYKTTVATLVDEVQQAGYHEAGFNAVDARGNNLPEGIYKYRLKTENMSVSRNFFVSHPK